MYCFIICTALEATGVCFSGRVYGKELLDFQKLNIVHNAVVRNNLLEMHVAMQMNLKNDAQ